MFREGFRRFAARIAALEGTDDPFADLNAVGEAFRANARANPHLYDLMFSGPFPEFVPGPKRPRPWLMGTFGALVEAIGRCVDAGLLEGSRSSSPPSSSVWSTGSPASSCSAGCRPRSRPTQPGDEPAWHCSRG